MYAEPLFEEAIPSMSPTVCSILLAVVAVFAGIGAAYMTESLGRRVSLLDVSDSLVHYASYPFKVCLEEISLELYGVMGECLQEVRVRSRWRDKYLHDLPSGSVVSWT